VTMRGKNFPYGARIARQRRENRFGRSSVPSRQISIPDHPPPVSPLLRRDAARKIPVSGQVDEPGD
jgi:hypothetical protein